MNNVQLAQANVAKLQRDAKNRIARNAALIAKAMKGHAQHPPIPPEPEAEHLEH